LVKCEDYGQKKVDEAVRKSLELIGGLDKLVRPGERVLLKPNMHNSDIPEKAVTTHPTLLKSVARMVKEARAEALVGDSPGLAYTHINRAWQRTGLRQAAEEEGATAINFREVYEINNSANRKIPLLHIARPVMDSEVVISLPKLKTHSFTLLSGAIKNLYGCIPGFRKKELHALAPRPLDFAHLMADILSTVRPKLAIMDAVVGMEGEGPVCGSPRRIGLIMASTDLVALDAVASYIIGYHPLDVDITRVAAERGLGKANIDEIEVRGLSLDEAKIADYELTSSINVLLKRVPGPVLFVLKYLAPLLLKVEPIVDPLKCTKCGTCLEHCPTGAMNMDSDYPIIARKKCIKCFCCQEVCLERAVGIQYNWLARKLKM
jgi:uncharacterized protein (DUF362 family)/NAD-dependent dihydropyrimidine dehydrogenase PreA subunit